MARQVAVAAHAVRLTDDLQRSRERLVLAREEERRRLRRDLHDGLGSALAGLALYAGNARRALPAGLTEVARWATQLEDGIGAAVVDVRRIVDDLRPPALDELGLLGALRQQRGRVAAARQLRRTGGTDSAAGGGRGSGLPDRGRGAGQRRPAQSVRPRHGTRQRARRAGSHVAAGGA